MGENSNFTISLLDGEGSVIAENTLAQEVTINDTISTTFYAEGQGDEYWEYSEIVGDMEDLEKVRVQYTHEGQSYSTTLVPLDLQSDDQ